MKKNPLDLFKTIDDLRKDEALTKDIIALFSIVQAAGEETGREFKADKKIAKGFSSLSEGIDIACNYLRTGKISTATRLSLVFKYKGMKDNTQHLSQILKDEDHAVTKTVAARITSHKDFDETVARIYEKANDKMIRLAPAKDGGMEIFELVSGQDLCIARLNAEQSERLNKTLLSRLAPKNDNKRPPDSKLG